MYCNMYRRQCVPQDGDTIITYAYSSVVAATLLAAHRVSTTVLLSWLQRGWRACFVLTAGTCVAMQARLRLRLTVWGGIHL
jgi:hypothetical protein